MKKFLQIACAVFVILSAAVLASCGNTASIEFNNKISKATEYSFNIVYTDSADGSPIYISCYTKNDSYAYRFSKNGFNNESLAYRHIFTNGTFYEIWEAKSGGFWTGEYKKTEDVDVNYDGNFMYKYTNSITSGSFITLLQKGKDVVYKDAECTQFDFKYKENNYTYVFEKDTDNLVKFVLSNAEGTKTLEYSDYKFESIDDTCLEVPSVSIGLGGVQLYREVETFTYEYVIG